MGLVAPVSLELREMAKPALESVDRERRKACKADFARRFRGMGEWERFETGA